MTCKELTDEELQEIADTYGLYTEQDVENRVSCELLRIGARNEDLETENKELKEVHESDKRSLRLIAEKGADLEKENADLREELTETKRLLARWIDDRPYTVSEQKDLIADTEQYLNEVGK